MVPVLPYGDYGVTDRVRACPMTYVGLGGDDVAGMAETAYNTPYSWPRDPATPLTRAFFVALEDQQYGFGFKHTRPAEVRTVC